jgi:tetratricopeptide (TPR) repeat protein
VVWANRVAVAAAAVLIVGWALLEVLGRVAWADAEPRVRQEVSEGKVKEGMERLRSVGRGYPGTLVASSLLPVERGLFRDAFYRMEEGFDRALALRREGRFSEARKTLQQVAEAELTSGQAKRARDAIRDIEAAKNEASDLRESAEYLLKSGSHEEAFIFCRKVIDKYPEAAGSLQVPFLINSTPSPAEVKVDGSFWGYTPVWVIVSFKGEHEVTVAREGFQPQVLKGLLARRSPFVSVQLGRKRG